MRAAGYFTSTSLALVAAGLPSFIAHDGTFRLIASPYLDAEDRAALELGVTAREDLAERALLKSFVDSEADEIVRDRLGFLAWLLATDRLVIRIALPTADSGLYHEKYGVFVDTHGDAVAFTGSPNETRGGLESNFESIDVFESWSIEGFRVQLKRQAFEAAWRNDLAGLETIALPDAVTQRLLRYRPASKPERDPLEAPVLGSPAQPVASPGVVPRDYQVEAVEAWMRAGNRGVVEMATGTGKTVTALLAVTRWLGNDAPSMVVVAAPFKHLVDQWAGEMRRFDLNPVLCYDAGATWQEALERAASDLRIGVKSVAACVATHDALRSSRFAGWFSSLPGSVRTVLVGDEVHNLGSPRSIEALNRLDFDARIGLSATPRRWSDLETAGIFEYFGDTVFEFPLDRAIREGYLVPYAYYPHVVELSDDEFGRYVEITRKLAKFGPSNTSGSPDPATEEVRGALLRQRAAVLNNAEAKLVELAGVVDDHRLRFALVYTTPEQMDATVRVVADDGRRLVHRFTYRESAKERQTLLSLFESGGMDALVAIRCLDEGVDIPKTETAYILASSSNSREFIQRRGRILRRADGKDRAVIHDFLAVPPRGMSDERTWAIERSIMKREIARFDEFAALAVNRYQAESALLPVRHRYGIF